MPPRCSPAPRRRNWKPTGEVTKEAMEPAATTSCSTALICASSPLPSEPTSSSTKTLPSSSLWAGGQHLKAPTPNPMYPQNFLLPQNLPCTLYLPRTPKLLMPPHLLCTPQSISSPDLPLPPNFPAPQNLSTLPDLLCTPNTPMSPNLPIPHHTSPAPQTFPSLLSLPCTPSLPITPKSSRPPQTSPAPPNLPVAPHAPTHLMNTTLTIWSPGIL